MVELCIECSLSSTTKISHKSVLTCICLTARLFRMTLRDAPSDRDVRTRSAASRDVDLETRYVFVEWGKRDNKVNVYLPSLRMKVPDHVYVLGHSYTCHT
jgi:hypothetical protein